MEEEKDEEELAAGRRNGRKNDCKEASSPSTSSSSSMLHIDSISGPSVSTIRLFLILIRRDKAIIDIGSVIRHFCV